MRYLLDTNIVSELMRHPRGAAAQRAANLDDDMLCTSIIVIAELRFGIAKRASAELARKLALVLDVLDIMPFDTPADMFYAQIREELERAGRPISANDMLIAAHALALGCTLVTDNEREFSRVQGLTIENWLR